MIKLDVCAIFCIWMKMRLEKIYATSLRILTELRQKTFKLIRC